MNDNFLKASAETSSVTSSTTTQTFLSIETLSKASAALVVAIYICGFLVTTAFDARLGFVETSPLRPHLLSAGIWLLIFLLIPLFSIGGMKNVEKAPNGIPLWAGYTDAVFNHWLTSISVAFLFSGFFDLGNSALKLVPVLLILITVWIPLAILARKMTKFRKLLSVLELTVVVFYTVFSLFSLFIGRHFAAGALFLWLFFIGFVYLFEMGSRSWQLRLGNWPQTVVMFLTSSLLFGAVFYPHIRFNVGGGQSVQVIIDFAKDASYSHEPSVKANLVDETDSGFYIVDDSGNAVYIARSQVSTITFPHKTSRH